ncbi:ribulose-5-phosphate 4-epimerase related epimerase / aldolase [Klebsiella variicola]|nr:ribulose-5-phosphate 4-epimerase related epimerase / aldolase [Klebsiella variicola]
MFDEVTASNLIVVDMQGKVVEGDAPANSAGFTIHSAVHMAREDAHCVIHTHTLPGMAVAACEDGLPAAQPDQHRVLPARRLPSL